MNKTEINQLLKQIKIMYARFDSVKMDGMKYGINPEVTDAWWSRIGWMDMDRALKILDRHMESEDGSKVPTISLWMNNGKVQQRSEGYESAVLEQWRGVIRWQPEPDGDVYERKIVRAEHGCYEDEDGYLWAFPGG